MNDIFNPIKNAVDQLASALESNQNRMNRAIYDAQPDPIQKAILQNCYDNNIPVDKISTMTGVPKSTIYSKIRTK